jgi:hypothetical protein
MLVAPERRMSSAVMTWIADAVLDSFSGCLETEVTSKSVSSSRLRVFNTAGGVGPSAVWELARPTTPNEAMSANTIFDVANADVAAR